MKEKIQNIFKNYFLYIPDGSDFLSVPPFVL